MTDRPLQSPFAIEPSTDTSAEGVVLAGGWRVGHYAAGDDDEERTLGIRRRDRDMDPGRLRGIDLFSTAEDDELRRIAELGDLVEVPEGTVLAEQDVFEGGEFFVIVDGTAEVTKDGSTVRTMEPGTFFGEMGALEPRKRSATVTAATDMEVLVFTRMAFDQLIGDAPNVTRKIVREMGRRLRALEDSATGG